MGGELVSTRDRLDWNFLDPTRKVGLKRPSNPTNPYTHNSIFFFFKIKGFGVYYYTKVFEMPYARVSKRKEKKKPYASIFGRFSICFQIIMK